MKLTLLALGWALYGALHSLLADARLKAWVRRRLPIIGARYRLCYNLFALLALAPLVYAAYASGGPRIIRWAGGWAWLSWALSLTALLGLYKTRGAYELGAFLGLRPEAPRPFRVSPAHRWVRHPWYSLSLILLWTRDMTPALLISALSVTLYILIGSRLEERRLIAEIGAAYEAYRARVPGLLPWRGQALRPAEAAALERAQ